LGGQSRFGTSKQLFVRRSQVFCSRRFYLAAHTRLLQSPRMSFEVIRYLCETAQTCVRLARACPHQATSHGLEEVAVDLMAKAQELEREARK
jgi:hypothetical protein